MVRDYDESEIPAVHNLEEVPPVRDEPGFRQVVYRGLDQMVALSVVQPDKKDTDTHSHPGADERPRRGRTGLRRGDEQVTLEQYDALTVPPGVEHTSRAISDEEAKMLVIWPLREDRVAGTEYQTEFPTE